MEKIGNSFIFHEKYSPQSIEDIILPKKVKEDFLKMVESGDFQHLLLTGDSGVGKSTISKALCNQIGLDYLFLNSSIHSNIDVLRTDIQDFASTISLSGKGKAVILDEADGLNKESTQKALRAFMDEFNVRFILTANYENKLIDPLIERCSHYKFTIPKEERSELMQQMFDRIIDILEKENIEYEEKAIAALIKSEFPNFRKILIDLQKYSLSGKIDVGILSKTTDGVFKELVEILKSKKFDAMRQWVTQNLEIGEDKIYNDLYKQSKQFMEPASIPQMILLISEYQYKAYFVASSEINLAACLTEIMSSCSFK